ncbi:hypothetical protein Tsubulata_027617 [Turnera subulata]|uniref:Mechanosensitive ion channel protein n=1 Tax=Turnera subulata TaxID=218843 RepID=A0A9Q0GD91_9ROSI|nr:hypothetical protein Tsubulata_027617 [Turnera subulata]
METGPGLGEKKGTNHVVLQIPTYQEPPFTNHESIDTIKPSFAQNSQSGSSPKDSNLDMPELQNLRVEVKTPTSSSDITRPVPSPHRPPKISVTESISRRRSLTRSEFSKPKSRLVEPSYANEVELIKEVADSSPSHSRSPSVASPSPLKSTPATPEGNLESAPVNPKTPLIGQEDEDEDDEVYKTAILKVNEPSGKKSKVFFLTEFTLFVCIMGFLTASLTVHRLFNSMIWGLELWKWCVLVLVIFSGRLFSEWIVNVLVFLIEKNYLLKKKVLYFVYGLRKSVQAFIWLGLVLLAWGLLFDGGVKRTRKTSKILHYVTRTLASFLTGAGIWLAKTFLVKLVASSFHVNRFFDRIQESIFHQYIVRTLSGPPVMEMGEKIGSSTEKQNKRRKEIDMVKKMKHGKVSVWTMRGLIDMISGTRISTLSGTLDESDDEEGKQKDKEITSELEAKAAAYKIFKNVAKPDSKYIGEDDLLRFMERDEVENVIPLFEGAAATREIKRPALRNWLVKEIENVNKMKLALYVNHTINFQNPGDRGNRRSDLMLELKKILEDLDIKYHLLPQEVRLKNI